MLVARALVMRSILILPGACVCAMVIGGVSGTLMAPDYDRNHRFPPQVSLSVDDLSSLAGEYHQGARLGMSLSLSILHDGRYSFIWSGCTGVHHRESGYVGSIDGSYVLSPLEMSEAQD